jgi:uncharacterized membrane protein YkgB
MILAIALGMHPHLRPGERASANARSNRRFPMNSTYGGVGIVGVIVIVVIILILVGVIKI